MNSHPSKPQPATSSHEPIELTLARLLRIGSLIAAVLIAVGLGIMLSGNEQLASHLVTAGLLVLMATPVVRVVTAGIIFIREKDWRFACFCLFVFCALLTGILLGHTHG